MNIFNELPTAFPWYDKKEKQQRFRENAQQACDYKLIAPQTGLLPFQLKVETGLPRPTGLKIWTLSDIEAMDLSNNITLLRGVLTEEGLYAYYDGAPMQFKPGSAAGAPLSIGPGKYYATLSFANGNTYYSEVFTVVEDLAPYMKVEYWNGCDISPLLYKTTGWKQIAYLDTFVHVLEPEIEEDGERDGTDQLITTYQKMSVKYRLSVVVPDYMKVAITSMQMHDNVYLTTNYGVRSGKIDRMTTTATVEATGAYSTVDVILEQVIMLKQSCCDEVAITEPNPWNL